METLYKCSACHGDGWFKYDLNKSIECADCKGDGYVPLHMLDTQPPKLSIDELFKCSGIMTLAGVTEFDKGMKGSIPFNIGDKFKTLRGTEVECIQLSTTKGYETARFSDGAWRYNRDFDRGRCTGSRWDAPRNIVPRYPEPVKSNEPVWGLCPNKNKNGGCTLHNLHCGYPKCDTIKRETV